MGNVNDKEQADQGAGSRGGGNLQTKGANKAPDTETDESQTKGGGNIQNRGASEEQETPAHPDKS